MKPLERYRDVIDDFESFVATCRRPLPTTVRVNTIKTSVERARSTLSAEGVEYEPIEWNPNLLTLETDSPGTTWASFHGFTHGQEEVSNLPPVILDPQPGERIWDACGAPGGKSTQLAALANDRATIVANDSNLGRLTALRFNAERLGVTSLLVTNRDARNYSMKPFPFDRFDRVLADVPCSCEGTIRKNPDALEDWSEQRIQSISGVQKGILRRAIQVTKPGGTIVYSTCTFAPEENEAVVQHALDTESCRLVDVIDATSVADVTNSLSYDSGLREWGDESYDSSLERTMRIYPHQNDTGGFFIAKLKKGGSEADARTDREDHADSAGGGTNDVVNRDGSEPTDSRVDTADSTARIATEADDPSLEPNVGHRFDRLPKTDDERTVAGRPTRADVLRYFSDRFDITPDTFDGYTFWEKGAGKIWIYAGDATTPVEIEALGMTCLRTRQEYWKPTTDFVQRFGDHASDCVIDLDREQARQFVAGMDQSITWDGDWGYLIAAHEIAGEREPLGVGLYVHGTLQSMVPKGRRRDV